MDDQTMDPTQQDGDVQEAPVMPEGEGMGNDGMGEEAAPAPETGEEPVA